MERLRDRLKRELGRDIPSIGGSGTLAKSQMANALRGRKLSPPGTGIATLRSCTRRRVVAGMPIQGIKSDCIAGFSTAFRFDPNGQMQVATNEKAFAGSVTCCASG